MNEKNDRVLRLGLIGKDVSKSQSEKMHAFILEAFGVELKYESASISEKELDETVRRFMREKDGFNVTIPYKSKVRAYLASETADATLLDSVNTVLTTTAAGYNTDGIGFSLMLENAGIDVRGKTVLVLGIGGAGRSTALSLKNAGARVFAYRRNRSELEKICASLGVEASDDPERESYEILVNCTGVGMHDTEGSSPLTAAAIARAETLVDLIYHPAESEFLRLGRTLGKRTLNGAAMLFYQAYYADCIYLNETPDRERAAALYEKYLLKEGNL